MKELYLQIFEHFKVVFESNDLDTTFFLTSYDEENEYSYIKEINGNIVLEFDITCDRHGIIGKFLETNSEFESIETDFEQYENKYEDEEGKYKYYVDLYITNHYIRKFKINKLLLK
jgi:hypothetical protein